MTVKKSVPLLNQLRRAVKKVKFLLSFSATKWIVSSTWRSSSGPRRLSFNTSPSLLDSTEDYAVDKLGPELGVSRTTSLTASEISRTTSNASVGDDINQRADRFIQNFYHHIQMERQVSLELRYCKERSLDRLASH